MSAVISNDLPGLDQEEDDNEERETFDDDEGDIDGAYSSLESSLSLLKPRLAGG